MASWIVTAVVSCLTATALVRLCLRVYCWHLGRRLARILARTRRIRAETAAVRERQAERLRRYYAATPN